MTNQSKSSSTKNILKLSKNIENLYEKIVSDSEDTKKYDKEMKEYLNEHNYKKSNDVSPKMIYQQINNSKNKISINEGSNLNGIGQIVIDQHFGEVNKYKLLLIKRKMLV